MFKHSLPRTIALLIVGFGFAAACGDDEDDDKGGGTAGAPGSPEQTGAICKVADDCFPKIDKTQLKGQVQCLDRVRNGYCTHLCETDADCCAVTGECETDIKQVCSPFESTGQKMCFLSCEPGDLSAAPDAGAGTTIDEAEFCQTRASPDFICRSSGGGAENRKVCVPGDCGVGAACVDDTYCDPGQVCSTAFRNGYCTKQGCTLNADCGADSMCVAINGANYCLKKCAAETDCSFCRWGDPSSTCTDAVTYVETGGSRVCSPTPIQ